MTKICILTSVHPVFSTRIFHKQAKTLTRSGYDVTIIAQSTKNKTVDGIKIIALPSPKNRIERIFFLTKKIYKLALQQKANIYHFHDPELLPWAVKLKKKTGAKIIYDIHENIPGQILTKPWLPKFSKKLIAYLYKEREKKKLLYIDWLILAEDSYKELYKNYTNTTVIRNYPLIFKNLIKKQGIKFESPRLVYAGAINRKRGLLEMIESVKILKPRFSHIQLKIAGAIRKELKSKMNNLIDAYQLKNNIIFLGRIPYTEVPYLLSQSNTGLSILYPVANYIESLPTKLLEYMAAGLPVIASDFPLYKKFVEKNKCGLTVDPFIPIKIAKAIEYLIKHPKKAQKMGENGRKAILENYNWKNESKKLLKVYGDLLK